MKGHSMIHLVEYIGTPACYEALAEECVELSHAALKQARLLRGENPVGDKYTQEKVHKMLVEEATDVLLILEELGMQEEDWRIYIQKRERMLKRFADSGIERQQTA